VDRHDGHRISFRHLREDVHEQAECGYWDDYVFLANHYFQASGFALAHDGGKKPPALASELCLFLGRKGWGKATENTCRHSCINRFGGRQGMEAF